jgi:uncharacterized protein YjdB
MRVRNPLLPLLLSSSFLIACGPADTAPSQSALSALETRLAGIEASLNPESPVAGEAVQEIAVQPPAFALNVGSSKKMELITLTTANGEKTVLTGFNVLDMSMEDTRIATISAEGEVTALKAGTTILEIGLGKNKKSVPVVVLEGTPSPSPTPTPAPAASATPTPTPTATPAPTATPLPSSNLKSISISPDTMTLIPNESAALRIFVTLNDADGSVGALNNIESAELSSSNSSVATVNTSGVVTAKAKGVATITATYKTLKATLVVTVEEDN